MPFPDESMLAQVVDPRPDWPDEFAALARALRKTLGGPAVSIDHIGSTSVPGLAAKDCIDLQIQVRDLDDPALTAALVSEGFRLRPEPWNRSEVSGGVTCPKLTFAPPVGARAANLHVRLAGAPNARFALLFRDYLRADASAREAWGAFKRRLAERVADLFAYGQIKAPATAILMIAAERWAAETGWPPDDRLAGEGGTN